MRENFSRTLQGQVCGRPGNGAFYGALISYKNETAAAAITIVGAIIDNTDTAGTWRELAIVYVIVASCLRWFFSTSEQKLGRMEAMSCVSTTQSDKTELR